METHWDLRLVLVEPEHLGLLCQEGCLGQPRFSGTEIAFATNVGTEGAKSKKDMKRANGGGSSFSAAVPQSATLPLSDEIPHANEALARTSQQQSERQDRGTILFRWRRLVVAVAHHRLRFRGRHGGMRLK